MTGFKFNHVVRQLIIIFYVGTITFFTSCKKKETVAEEEPPVVPSVPTSTVTSTVSGGTLVLPRIPFSYIAENLPFYLQTDLSRLDNTPADNPITNHGATLGRVLFYDKQLSVNNRISCASCHKQANAFADPVARSVGFNNGLTRRNSMALINVRLYANGKMFWDERAANLESQVLMPIADQIEMGMNLQDLPAKLSGLGYYQTLFRNAFGSETITTDRIAKALSQFIRSLLSYSSKYDRVRAGQASLTASEQLGYNVFYTQGPLAECSHCHAGSRDLQSGLLPIGSGGIDPNDAGVYEITGATDDRDVFKVQSLRNVALTAPYFHDGSIATLEGFFNTSHHDLQMTPEQKQGIIAFLKTLSDTVITTHPRFSDPFR